MVAVLILIACIAFIVTYLLSEEMHRQASDRQEANIRVAWEILEQSGTDFRIINNDFYAGENKLNGVNTVVDKIEELVGGTATVFMRDTRVTTNVIKADGSRAIGTKLAKGPVYDAIFKEGKSYRGEADILGTNYFTAYDPIISSSGEVVGILYVGIKKDEFFHSINEILTVIIYVVIGFGVLLCSIFFLLTRHVVTAPLDDASGVIKAIAHGDLSFDLFFEEGDEISSLYNAFHTMQLKLTDVILRIRAGVNEVSVSSEQVSRGNTDLSQRTQEQASSLEEVASSMEEMTGTVNQNAENAEQANQLAKAARDQAEKGGEVASQAATAMDEINDASNQIADIIGVIDDIAFQTNLLALNAAVEAARAGEQGRGFAVVANEVRNLAGRCATAAKEIKALIKQSVDKVEGGTKLVDQSGQNLEEIVLSVKKVSDIVAEIATASLEQSDGIAQVNKAILQLDEMTQQNASLVEEAASASEMMETQAQELSASVAYFKINDSAEAETNHDRQGTPEVAHKPTDSTGTSTGNGKGNGSGRPLVHDPAKALPLVQAEDVADDSEWQEF